MNEGSNPLADEIRQARKPRLDLALPPRADVGDEAVEAHSREIGGIWGATTRSSRRQNPKSRRRRL